MAEPTKDKPVKVLAAMLPQMSRKADRAARPNRAQPKVARDRLRRVPYQAPAVSREPQLQAPPRVEAVPPRRVPELAPEVTPRRVPEPVPKAQRERPHRVPRQAPEEQQVALPRTSRSSPTSPSSEDSPKSDPTTGQLGSAESRSRTGLNLKNHPLRRSPSSSTAPAQSQAPARAEATVSKE